VAEDIPPSDPLYAYLVCQDTARRRRAAEVFNALSDRERRLVKEAAVMGYVQGRMHPDGAEHPKDAEVVFLVIDGCLSNPDLYPTLAGRDGDDEETPDA